LNRHTASGGPGGQLASNSNRISTQPGAHPF
jgi:hypothetical protein